MACCVDLRIGGTEILYVHATSLGKPNFSAFLLSVQFKQTHFAFSRITLFAGLELELVAGVV